MSNTRFSQTNTTHIAIAAYLIVLFDNLRYAYIPYLADNSVYGVVDTQAEIAAAHPPHATHS
jgi:hypothetical protein